LKITIIGAGYVGLVSGACFADVGNEVLCLDLDEAKIRTLRGGGIPIYEPGLAEVVRRNQAAGRLMFGTDVEHAVRFGVVQCIAVGTPPDEDGSADLQHVLAAARSIGRHMTDYRVVVDKSTVPVGTADKVRAAILAELAERKLAVPFAVVSNPEFLKEGAAVEDFMRPDRIVVGADDPQAIQVMRTLYAPFQRNHERLILTDVRSAELTKYAANAMLATRISFMNELANLAERLGADIEEVRKGIGSDPRIGYAFLYAGAGYGGSCFPKDVKALIRTAQEAGGELPILEAVERVNAAQKHVLARKILQRFGGKLAGRRIAVWGLAFKPNTDDMREASSTVLIEELIAAGATVSAYDPVATPVAKSVFAALKGIHYAETPIAALENADALAVVTEWQEFRSPDFQAIRARLKTPAVFDGRNLYDPQELKRHGLEYYPIGRTTAGTGK
jgi:UDPglucose 6-dehydrogenase